MLISMSMAAHTDIGFWMDMSTDELMEWKQDMDRIIKEPQRG
jgi:hypothetical protein